MSFCRRDKQEVNATAALLNARYSADVKEVPSILFVNEAMDEGRVRLGNSLAQRLGLSLGQSSEPARPRAGSARPGIDAAQDSPLKLVLTDELLELRAPGDRPGRGLFVDWSDLKPRRGAASRGFSRNQPLGRAIGKDTLTVLDATAGLGHDAALLACMGYRVLAVERSPILFALLEDGFRRALADAELSKALGERLHILNADARALIAQLSSQNRPDVDIGRLPAAGSLAGLDSWTFPTDAVYIDPMFPPKRKASALAKKEIRMVRELVGDDADAGELLAMARQHVRRVVVKRPTYAEPLEPKPTASITGKLVRYDVYVKAGVRDQGRGVMD